MEGIMHQYTGKLIIHTGSMFSGKTSSLTREINRFSIAGYSTRVYKPDLDTRNKDSKIKTHDDLTIRATTIKSIDELKSDVLKELPDVIGIDEIQFLKGAPNHIKEVLDELLESGKTVIVAGLDMDYNGQAFEVVKELLPVADYVHKHHAVCTSCGSDAWVSYRTVDDKNRLLIGSEREYMPLCRSCYSKKVEEDSQIVNKNQIELNIEK